MNEKSQRTTGDTIAILLLIVSLIGNVYLFMGKSKTSNGFVDLATRYTNDMLGHLNGLEELLDSAEEKNWSDANSLCFISSQIDLASRRASDVAGLSGEIDRRISYDTFTRISDFGIDLREAYFAFDHAAADRGKGLSIDTQELEKFRNKIKRAKFPNQTTPTWQNLHSSIDRYFKEN